MNCSQIITCQLAEGPFMPEPIFRVQVGQCVRVLVLVLETVSQAVMLCFLAEGPFVQRRILLI